MAGTVEVCVHSWTQTCPLPLNVNGYTINIPIGVQTTIPAHFLPALKDVMGVKMEVLGAQNEGPKTPKPQAAAAPPKPKAKAKPRRKPKAKPKVAAKK